ncbi:transposase [Chloroflexota bacterium]
MEEFQKIDEGKEVLCDLVEWLFQELFELEFNEQIGAKRYEKSEERQWYRNGLRIRDLLTRVVWITFRFPRARNSFYHVTFWTLPTQ